MQPAIDGQRKQSLGIGEEDQAKLFTTFYRVKSNDTRDIPGTGLSLYITKSLVNMMGGKVELRSSLGIGSSFSFTIPIGTAELEAESAPQGAAGSRLARLSELYKSNKKPPGMERFRGLLTSPLALTWPVQRLFGV